MNALRSVVSHVLVCPVLSIMICDVPNISVVCQPATAISQYVCLWYINLTVSTILHVYIAALD